MIKDKKAPGPDCFNPEIVKRVWSIDNDIYLQLFNNCLRKQMFPTAWKTAYLKVILKSPDRDRSAPGSYRPIALLSVIGKIYERIILNRIQKAYSDKQLMSRLQYGFRKNCSTDDALHDAISRVRTSESKYVVSLFIDIVGAFDNLWWPAIKSRLVEAECSTNLLNIINSYFTSRTMIIRSNYNNISKQMQKGCPQGSVMGPFAWNWCADRLLSQMETIENDDIYTIAFADDLLIIINGNSRNEIETKANRALQLITDWCKEHKLTVSINKSKAMLMKGIFHTERLPNIKIGEQKIKYVNEYKYLGVLLDSKLNFIPHVKKIKERIIKLTNVMKKITNETWGLKNKVTEIYYKSVYLPIITYGATVWYDKVNHTHVNRQLKSIQRHLLLISTRACRTTSTVAMQVAAHKLPLDLEVTRKGIIHKVRRKRFVEWDTYRYVPPDDPLLVVDLKQEKKN